MSKNLIEVTNLYRTFGETVAVKGLSLHVASGEIYGLVGPDGAGKTTTIRLLCGAYLPSHTHDGEPMHIEVGGYDVLTQTDQARAQIGYLPQRFSLYEELTVLENIRFFAEARGLASEEWRPRCMEILGFVGLDEFLNRRAGQLSGGMKQKLGLAAALVHRPHILLLDEPTTGVDPVTRQDFWQLIIRLVAEENDNGHGTAVLVSTPYMDEAARCTRVGFMDRGSLIVEGSPVELSAGLEGCILELAGNPLPMLRSLAQDEEGVEGVQMFGDRLHLRIRPEASEQVITRLQERASDQGAQISRLRSVSPQLEDVFMDLLKAEP
jgi:ABC-2 type transport system ATP-binding protein